MRSKLIPGIRSGRRTRFFLIGVFLSAQGCLVKHTVRIPVSPRILAAKSATLDQVLSLLADRSTKTLSLSSGTLKVSFTSGMVESGKLQAYRSAPGYILLKRPDSIRLNIQNPITKTSIAELLSVGDSFSLWVPRDNKFFIGRNSAQEFDLEGHSGFTARPVHIFEAILPPRIDEKEPGKFLSVEEDIDEVTKYYVIGLFRGVEANILRPARKFWVDRSVLAVTRQMVYNEDGQIASLINYGRLTSVDGIMLPLSIRIDRPMDGYTLDLQFVSWRLNPELPDSAFVLQPPSGAQIVQLKEKGRIVSP